MFENADPGSRKVDRIEAGAIVQEEYPFDEESV